MGALPSIGTTPQLPIMPFSPQGLSVDPKTGNIFVADINNNRIKKFNNNFGYIKDWGGYGSGNGQFKAPYGVAVDATSHDVYVSDLGNNRIQKFTSSGTFIKAWGKQGSGVGQFDSPRGVAVDSSTHDVYVADAGNERIQKFTNTGNYITKWGNYGSGNGQFNEPYGVAVDATTHEIYTAEDEGFRIQKFQLVSPCPSSTIQIVSGVCFITKWGSQGSGIGQFDQVFGVAPDSSHNVFVADKFNHRIQKFTNYGGFISKWP